MEVSEKVKSSYQGTGKTKYITLDFPELDISIQTGDGKIYSESMRLSESLVDSKSIEFVGCISSMFKIQVSGLKEDIKGKKIVVKIHTEGTKDEPVPLFSEVVDSAVKKSNSRVKEITAYDELYTKGNTEVSGWYKSLVFPISLKQIRDSLFEYIGLTQIEIDLPNDGIEIKKQYNPSTLQALSVIKAICQINGAFGIINRNGKFEYRILAQSISAVPYPSTKLFPSGKLFPLTTQEIIAIAEKQNESISPTEFSFYRDVKYEEFEVKPVDKLTIRQSEDDKGIAYGDGDNNYIIQGNMFTYGLSDSVLRVIAENIYGNVQGFSYIPFTSQNNGFPFLECGLDTVTYMMLDFDATEEASDYVFQKHSFYILSRELTGIQALKDSYSAEGEEYQSEFITDLQTQIDTIKKKVSSDSGNEGGGDDGSGGTGGGFANIESVYQEPDDAKEGVIYIIQGMVIVE